MVKKNFVVAIIFTVSCALAAGLFYLKQHSTELSMPDKERIHIGVVQLVEHPALNRTNKAIRESIEAENKRQGSNKFYVYDYECAQNDPKLLTPIITKLIAKDVKVIIALGTSAAQAAAQITRKQPENERVPVLFASVTDPVAADLVKNLKEPGGNISGVSNEVPIEKQFNLFVQALGSKLKVLGVIYNPGEVNSHACIGKMEAQAKKMGFKLLTASAFKTTDVAAAAQSLVGKVDAIFVNNDNTALSAFKAIAKVSAAHNIPLFVSDIDIADAGAVLAVGADQYEIGKKTAEMILNYFNNHVQVGKMAVEYPKTVEIRVSQPLLSELGLSPITPGSDLN